MAQQYDNSGSLWKNDRKERDSHPDLKGSITVDGSEYWISAWTKTGQKGKFLSLSVQRKEQAAPKAKAKAEPELVEDLDDDIPW